MPKSLNFKVPYQPKKRSKDRSLQNKAIGINKLRNSNAKRRSLKQVSSHHSKYLPKKRRIIMFNKLNKNKVIEGSNLMLEREI